MSRELEARLSTAFSSIESFKKQYIATALSMFGPGFVWLIRNPISRGYMSANGDDPVNDPGFTLLCTYIAGSPIPQAHPRAQSVDMNTENMIPGQSTAGVMGKYSASPANKVPPGRIYAAEVCLGVYWSVVEGNSAIKQAKTPVRTSLPSMASFMRR
ncbi:uncharacterized protein KY384_001925 [Bacidia gigantensis]|uniref:uncharacterized protein n=1 Tax=Bacidia gigantensis TaxID=2732470 RepID=UPI001D055115|nr:uncharacterized protein KY384_001925 [Bacidia gigantensis]KAG8533142.1 hypothetical protein KY384_001925 [Bacidia gigantensis]